MTKEEPSSPEILQCPLYWCPTKEHFLGCKVTLARAVGTARASSQGFPLPDRTSAHPAQGQCFQNTSKGLRSEALAGSVSWPAFPPGVPKCPSTFTVWHQDSQQTWNGQSSFMSQLSPRMLSCNLSPPRRPGGKRVSLKGFKDSRTQRGLVHASTCSHSEIEGRSLSHSLWTLLDATSTEK